MRVASAIDAAAAARLGRKRGGDNPEVAVLWLTRDSQEPHEAPLIPHQSLDSKIVAVIGRLDRVPSQRALRELERRRSWLVGWSASPSADVLVLAHGAAAMLDGDALRRTRQRAAALGMDVISEHAFLRRLGILQPPAPAIRSFTADAIAVHSGLKPEAVRQLVLFDILEPDGEVFAFRDLVLARHLLRLLSRGVTLAALVRAATLHRRGHGADGRDLAAVFGAWASGAIDPGVAASAPGDASRLQERAEEAERVGNLARAERLYRQVLELDRDDAITWFAVGSLVQRQGRTDEAAALLRTSIELDTGLPDAWYALGCLAEDADDALQAIECFERALAVERNYIDAAFRLGILYLVTGDLRRAIPLLERYAAADPKSAWGARAREALHANAASL